MAGGISITFLLILVVFAAYIFRYKRLGNELRPGIVYDIFLWISFLSIAAVGVKTLINLF